jgi:hypothetical protein
MMTEYYRKTAAIVGTLFIIATVTSLISGVLLGTKLGGTDYLLHIADEDSMIYAGIFELILAVSLIGIGALMFPVLRKGMEGLAISYTGVRLMEAAFVVIATMSLLLMLTLGQGYSDGTLNSADSQSMGALLVALREWSLLLGTLFFLGLGALTLNYLLYQRQLVPRWISVWGLLGGLGILVYGVMGLFGTNTTAFDATTLLAAPLAVQEMVFAIWLIVKGFNMPTNAYRFTSPQAEDYAM